MSFAITAYVEILQASKTGDWGKVASIQNDVTKVFASMQDDPGKFADLQRAKFIMGLGHPITREISQDQIERVFAALETLPKSAGKACLAESLKIMSNCPYEARLNEIRQQALSPD